jgi:hypothetical protein
MRDVERYQKEFDMILAVTEDQAKRASYLFGVARIEQLFEIAANHDISQAEAWRIIDRNPKDAKSGLLALIEKVQERSR